MRDALAAAGLLALAAFLLTGPPALRTQAELADKVVRLHVLANSDAPADQALKLRVRDAVADRAAALLEGVGTRDEAAAVLRDALPELEALAERTVAENGGGYTVRAELVETAFPTKRYGGFALPAGRYQALRIVIGAGRGRNWWCVVFPPLCTAVDADAPEADLSAFSAEELRLTAESDAGYILKFRTVELWGRLRQAFR